MEEKTSQNQDQINNQDELDLETYEIIDLNDTESSNIPQTKTKQILDPVSVVKKMEEKGWEFVDLSPQKPETKKRNLVRDRESIERVEDNSFKKEKKLENHNHKKRDGEKKAVNNSSSSNKKVSKKKKKVFKLKYEELETFQSNKFMDSSGEKENQVYDEIDFTFEEEQQKEEFEKIKKKKHQEFKQDIKNITKRIESKKKRKNIIEQHKKTFDLNNQ